MSVNNKSGRHNITTNQDRCSHLDTGVQDSLYPTKLRVGSVHGYELLGLNITIEPQKHLIKFIGQECTSILSTDLIPQGILPYSNSLPLQGYG